MMISHPLASWWRGDRKIICLFAMYGLAAGTMMYVGGVLYDQQPNFVAIIGFLLNIPALILMTWVGGYFASPYGYPIFFDPVIVIP